MITAEEVIIPNRRVGRPRIPKAYTQTEEYKNNRKKIDIKLIQKPNVALII